MESSGSKALLELDLPEHGHVSLPLAGLGGRMVASLIDHALLGLAISSLGVVAFVLVGGDALSADLAMPGLAGLSLILPVAGPLLFELGGRGQTPGKMIVKLRVISSDGSAASPGQLLLRNVVRVVDFLPLLYFTGVAALFVSRRSQRLGDLIAGTIVVREDTQALADLDGLGETPPVPTALHGVPPTVLQSAKLLFDPHRALDPRVLELRAAELADLVRRHRPDLANESDEAICRQLRDAANHEGWQ